MQVQSHIMHGHDHTQHSAQRGGIRRSSVEGLAACLLGVPRWKARVWKAKYDKDHAAFGAGIKKTADHVPANIEPEAPSILPEILPSVGAANENEEENSDVDISDVRGGLLDKWKQHEQYSMGMRLAELSVMWHVNGWSNQKFPCFLAWATKHFPYAFGNLNHSRRFLDSFFALCRAGHKYVFSKYIARLCSGSRYAIISFSNHRRGQHQRKKPASNHPCVYGFSGALVLGTSRVSMLGIYRQRTNCEPCSSLWRRPSSLCR